MSIQHAINFIREAGTNKQLRKGLYAIKKADILPELAKQGYDFRMDEFEESINLLHVQCQTAEQAGHLFEVVYWFKMLYN